MRQGRRQIKPVLKAREVSLSELTVKEKSGPPSIQARLTPVFGESVKKKIDPAPRLEVSAEGTQRANKPQQNKDNAVCL